MNALSPKRWQAALHREASDVRGGFWYRLSQSVMRRPVPFAAGATALLIALGLPFLGIQFTGVDATVLPREGHSARVVQDALDTEFPPNRTSPVYVAARGGDADRAAVERYARELGGCARGGRRSRRCSRWTASTGSTSWRPGLRSASRRRSWCATCARSPRPCRCAWAARPPASSTSREALADSLPLALGILATTTLVILFLMTGSVILPIKALVMNVLTLSAAFGLLVLIFQDGNLEGVLGFTSQGALESSQPVLLFAVAFGLSTDYGVFLLTRIKEAHDAGAPNEEAVALGLERTGRIVTFAALLFVIAIGAFATSEIIFIKQLGVGTALAVLIDATIVRALLVPSLMRLLGDWNWWAPRPLARLHQRIGLSESGPATA